jgi:hypothetical protein
MFFGAQPIFIRKLNDAQQQFFKDLVLYICKGYMALSSCENVWLQRLVLQQCPHVIFPSHSNLVEKVLFGMVQKTMNLHVLLYLNSATMVFISFDF